MKVNQRLITGKRNGKHVITLLKNDFYFFIQSTGQERCV
jgi:hypothetical protein